MNRRAATTAEDTRKLVFDRFSVLQGRLKALCTVPAVPVATAISRPGMQRWIARFQQFRLTAFARKTRIDTSQHSDISAGPISFGQSAFETRDSPRHQWVSGPDRQQFQELGYVVIRNVVPASITRNAVREITAFLGADLADSGTWYGGAPELDGIVPMHHAQSLWDIRQSPNLYQVFAEFFGTPRLMVDMNRCIFCPPVHVGFPTISRGFIHWDTDPRGPNRAAVQAVVLLTDVGRNAGGFQCLPEVYQNLDAWLKKYAKRADFDFFNPGLNYWNTTQIEGKAGDVILWSTKLPHGTAPNLSNRPRMAAFVTMQPPSGEGGLRESMKTWWLTKRAPDYWRGLPGQLDPEPGVPAVLSELGLKLIGVLPW